MTEINYEERYRTLIDIMGYDADMIVANDSFDKLEKVAKIFSRVRIAMLTEKPEETGALFITGIGGQKDDMGLPERLHICPTYGLSGSAIYTKSSEYSEPGY